MIDQNIDKDIAKELLTVISYCDNSFINNIPSNFLINLKELAADSSENYYIDNNKNLLEQNISNETKELLGILYYLYMTNLEEKEEMLNIWLNNEKNKDNI